MTETRITAVGCGVTLFAAVALIGGVKCATEHSSLSGLAMEEKIRKTDELLSNPEKFIGQERVAVGDLSFKDRSNSVSLVGPPLEKAIEIYINNDSPIIFTTHYSLSSGSKSIVVVERWAKGLPIAPDIYQGSYEVIGEIQIENGSPFILVNRVPPRKVE